jgi:hypothetical protein
MARKRINGLEQDTVFAAALLGGGYLLLRNSLPSIFGSVSPEDKAVLDSTQTDLTPDNIFLGTSTPYQDWFSNTEVSLLNQFGVTDYPSMYLAAYRAFLDGNLSPDNPLYLICVIYHQLHAAVTGHLFTGDQESAIQALGMITNKWQVGALSELWAYEAGDAWGSANKLFNSIRNGTIPMIYGLNPTDLAAQVNRLNNLPD